MDAPGARLRVLPTLSKCCPQLREHGHAIQWHIERALLLSGLVVFGEPLG